MLCSQLHGPCVIEGHLNRHLCALVRSYDPTEVRRRLAVPVAQSQATSRELTVVDKKANKSSG